MKKTAYGKPTIVNDNGKVLLLEKHEDFNESYIQDLILGNPECLPISDIDESYNPVIPVCKELHTPVGPLDILMVTPNGEIIIVETKLWRNPEARRVVVAQILDYAKELSKWSYEDLQREINRRLSRKGNALYEIVKSKHSDLLPPESDFVDSVSRNLERGRFLLLIAGDGIREGASGITEFLSSVGHLNFTFAMVELNLYKAEGIGTLVIPKTIVKTIEIPRLRVEIPRGLTISSNEDADVSSTKSSILSPEVAREKEYYSKFWDELIRELIFDDPGQPLPSPARAQNLFVYPGNTRHAWISAYFTKSNKKVGVYFRTKNDNEGHKISSFLDNDKDEIREELGEDVIWTWGDTANVGVHMDCEDVLSVENREEIKEFFKNWLNHFVNVFRPRMKQNGY